MHAASQSRSCCSMNFSKDTGLPLSRLPFPDVGRAFASSWRAWVSASLKAQKQMGTKDYLAALKVRTDPNVTFITL